MEREDLKEIQEVRYIMVRASPELNEMLNVLARRQDRSRSAVVRTLIRVACTGVTDVPDANLPDERKKTS